MDGVRHILDPLGRGPPRRAVVCPATGLIGDKTSAPHLPEIHALSEMCRECFDTEPRDPDTLLRRAFEDDLDSAWRALRDDILLGHEFRPDPSKIAAVLNREDVDELRTYACAMLTKTFEDVDVETLVERAVDQGFSDSVLAALQEATVRLDPDVVARLLEKRPGAARMFLTYPTMSHVPMRHPNDAMALCAHASSIPVKERYPCLALASLLARTGARVTTSVATDTMVRLRKSKFDVRVAAAAAALASFDSDPIVRAMSSVIESLAAHVQSRHSS